MTSAILAALQAVDPAVLTNIVRQDQRNPGFELLDWTVQPLSHEKIGVNIQALYGHPAAEVLVAWVTLTEFFMDRADEARTLMAQLAL